MATNKELESNLKKYQEETENKLNRILNLLDKPETVSAVATEPETSPVDMPVGNLPDQFKAVFTKYFDPTDGFTAEYDPIENTFDIIVPAKFSNAVPANLEFYKTDVRRKKLEATNPLGTIDAWCKKVVANLKYDKTKVTKRS